MTEWLKAQADRGLSSGSSTLTKIILGKHNGPQFPHPENGTLVCSPSSVIVNLGEMTDGK